MVTMAQIDEARERVAYWKRNDGDDLGGYSSQILAAEEKVEALLRQWWAQGCKEPSQTVSSLLADQRDEARAESARLSKRLGEVANERNLAQIERDGACVQIAKLEARAKEAQDAMQSAVDRCRDACEGNLSPGSRDYIDEVIKLLRVTRGQRDDAEYQIKQHRVLIDDWKIKYEALERHREDQENLIAELRLRIKRLTGDNANDARGHHKAKRCNVTFERGQLPLSPLAEKTIQKMIDDSISKHLVDQHNFLD